MSVTKRTVFKSKGIMFHDVLLIFCFASLISYQIAYTRPINEITETTNAPETQDLLTTNPETNDELKPSETQKAVCTVTSGDVRASAEAFTTRELKGVCGSTEMLTGFNDLELRLTKELQDLKNLINDLHRHILNHTKIVDEPVRSVGNVNITPVTFKFQPIQNDNKLQKSNEIRKNYYMTPKFKSLESKAQALRQQEISRFNNTLITDKDRDIKIYSYYWKMENCTKHLKDGNSISMESPIFSIKDKAFKIKAHFQHLHRDFLYLQLEDYSSSAPFSLGNSIILDTGGIFKEINSQKFKYKISILDQNKKRPSDLVSQEFDNHDNGFLIPNSALIETPFIKDDSILVQISLYI